MTGIGAGRESHPGNCKPVEVPSNQEVREGRERHKRRNPTNDTTRQHPKQIGRSSGHTREHFAPTQWPHSPGIASVGRKFRCGVVLKGKGSLHRIREFQAHVVVADVHRLGDTQMILRDLGQNDTVPSLPVSDVVDRA
ncbi:hypothetical protein ACFYWU_30400 [Streptomyces chrestomyceticus]|uniref:hypothetical protein n=1 Tax=Streptomyces chrestomyceticus TaxID=68185 RepID=UPI0036AC63A3